MAKSATAKRSTAVATTGMSSVPAHLKKGRGGVGLSSDASDNLVPLIYILQPLSPQVLKKNPAYIDGAEAGDFFLKGAANPIINGEDGMDFQPVAFWKSWTEWVPREKGGGLAAVYDDSGDQPINIPKDAKKEEGGFNYMRPNGNKIIQNRNFAGFVHGHGPVPLPYVLIFSSTGHTVAKRWMTTMNQTLIDPRDGEQLPIWSKKWHLTTEHKQNNQGEWFAINYEAGEWANPNEDAAGEGLANAFAAKEKHASVQDAPEPEPEETPRRSSRRGMS